VGYSVGEQPDLLISPVAQPKMPQPHLLSDPPHSPRLDKIIHPDSYLEQILTLSLFHTHNIIAADLFNRNRHQETFALSITRLLFCPIVPPPGSTTCELWFVAQVVHVPNPFLLPSLISKSRRAQVAFCRLMALVQWA